MKYIVPQEITSYTTNATDEALSEWTSGTYNNGDEVKVSADKMKYKFSGIDGATSSVTPSLDPTQWVKAPLNSHAMFFNTISSQTENADTIEVSFDAINIDSISFFNVECSEITITMTDNTTSTVFYNETFDMTYDDLADFGDYLFSERELRDFLESRLTEAEMQSVINAMSDVELLDRFTATPPLYYDANIQITISNTGGTAKCGYLVIGRQRDLGCSIWEGAQTGIMSFAKKERDSWGNVTLNQGLQADTMSLNVIIDNHLVDVVRNRLKAIDGIPCVFIGDETQSFSSLTIFGFYLDLLVPLNPTKSTYTLEIESLV